MKSIYILLLSGTFALITLSRCTKNTPENMITQYGPRGTIPQNPNPHQFLQPVASFLVSAIQSNFQAPAGFIFHNTSSYGQSYEWDFGDGTLNYETNPIHVYAVPGTYQVTLTVRYGFKSSKDTQRITVLKSLYTKFIIDSIRATVLGGISPSTVWFQIGDSANDWQSENFIIPALAQQGISQSSATQSFSFLHPDTISNFQNGFTLMVWDRFMRQPIPYNPEGGRRGTTSQIVVEDIIFGSIQPISLIGYPKVLQNPNLSNGAGNQVNVYISWR